MGNGHMPVVGIKEVYRDRTEGTANLYHLRPGEGIAQTGRQETDVHVRSRQVHIWAGLCEYGKAGGAVCEGHQQAAMERLKDTVIA